jgi:hypothetical protein
MVSMTNTPTAILQTSPYLIRQRNFPDQNPKELGIELSKTYIEIAQRVNDRTIGLFATNFAIITGESWFLSGDVRKQQTLRIVFQIPAVPAGGVYSTNLPEIYTGISTRIFGVVQTDLPDERPVPYASTVTGDNIAVRLDQSTNPSTLQFAVGSGSPNVLSGLMTVEFLSNIDTNT